MSKTLTTQDLNIKAKEILAQLSGYKASDARCILLSANDLIIQNSTISSKIVEYDTLKNFTKTGILP